MRLVCRDMNIIHGTNDFLVDAYHGFHLGVDLCFDPLLCDYIQHAVSICLNNPVPERMPMLADNMSGARGPRLTRPVDHGNIAMVNTINVHAQSLVASIYVDEGNGHKYVPL